MTPLDDGCNKFDDTSPENILHYLQHEASDLGDIADSEQSAFLDPLMTKNDNDLISEFFSPEGERFLDLLLIDDSTSEDFNKLQAPGEVDVAPSCAITYHNKDDTVEIPEEESERTNIGDKVPARKKSRPSVKNGRTIKKRKPKRQKEEGRANRSIHLWQFLQELLQSGTSNYIQWISKADGTFRLVNSSAVAKLWGQRKNRHNMTYEKMSRALRYYYEKEILERVPNARLIYKFGHRTMPSLSEPGEESLSDSSDN